MFRTLRGRVNDYANVMQASQVQSLESQLAQLERDTGHQVAVLTVPTLDGEDIEGFSIRVAENWKIGKKGYDNGAILVVAVKDRRLRLEVGYGLEGVLPDAIAKRITADYIVPHFRQQDYAGGIVAGIAAVDKIIRKEPLPEVGAQKNSKPWVEHEFPRYDRDHLRHPRPDGVRRRGRRAGATACGTPAADVSGPIIFGGPGGWGGGGFGGGGFGGGSGGGGFSGGGGGFGGGGSSDSW